MGDMLTRERGCACRTEDRLEEAILMRVHGYARVSTKLGRLARSIAITAAIAAWAGMAEAKDPPQPPSATDQAKPSKWKGWFGSEGGGSKWKGWFTLNPKKE
jgi:hypothetical protein